MSSFFLKRLAAFLKQVLPLQSDLISILFIHQRYLIHFRLTRHEQKFDHKSQCEVVTLELHKSKMDFKESTMKMCTNFNHLGIFLGTVPIRLRCLNTRSATQNPQRLKAMAETFKIRQLIYFCTIRLHQHYLQLCTSKFKDHQSFLPQQTCLNNKQL